MERMHPSLSNLTASRACPRCGFGGALDDSGLCPRCLWTSSLFHDDPDPLLGPSTDSLDPGPRPVPVTARLLGGCELLEEIARGGMGVVYRARQVALNRMVAAKVLAGGPFASPDYAHRFRIEAQTVARLRHPNIVAIHEVGESDGVAYFIMDLVEGPNLAERARRDPFLPREAVMILETMARAVAYAHAQGVLHRDLKPSNVLLDLFDQPQITDFGLAKQLDDSSSLATRQSSPTLSGQTLGSPGYAAPEQIRSGAATVQSDVYGLGATLYHLLTGRPPFVAATAIDTLQAAQHQDPVSPCALNPNVPRDLETICLKCLEKEPSKRYDTAQHLADDLERFLNDEPILARPVTRLERTVRWCRRQPALATAYAILLLLLLLLSIATPIAAYRINDARRQAAQEANTARAMLAFLRDDLLSVADPFAGNTERPRGRNLTLLAAVDLAARNVRQRFPDQPLVEGGLRVTLWQVYFALGDLDQAEEHIQRAFDLYDGADAPELERLKALESMAWMHHARGRYAEASGLIEPVLERRTRLQGADHPDALSAQRCRLAILASSSRQPEAIALGQDLLDRARQLPVEHTEVLLRIMGDAAWIYYRQGDFWRCHALSEEAFHIAQERLGNDHAVTIELMSDWAIWLRNHLGRFHEAEILQQEAYKRAREILGETHDLTLKSLSELALLADAKGLFGKKTEIQQQLVLLARQVFGSDSPSTIFEQMRLAWSRLQEGQPQEAEHLLADALARLREFRGSDDFLTRRAMRWLSRLFIGQGRYEAAIELGREELNRELRLRSAEAPWTHLVYYRVANLHARIGQWPQAAQLYAEFLPHYDSAKSRRLREDLYAAGLVAALLADDDAAVDTILPLALRHARQITPPWETRRNLIVSLLLGAERVPNGRDLDTVAAQVIAEAPVVPSPSETLLPALLSLRRNQFAETTRLLAPSLATPACPASGLASALTAIAQHRLGNTDEGSSLLLDARDHLERLSRAGDMGSTVWHPYEEWLPAAQLALACREAESLIHGTLIKPTLDETTLAHARDRWLPLRALLDRVDRAASSGNWPTALDQLRTAINQDYFDWSAALQSREHFAAKAAALLAVGNELGAYPELTKRIVHSNRHPSSLNVRTFFLLQGDSHASATLEALISTARLTADEAPASDAGNPWWWLELGLAELQAGNPQAALAALEPAVGAYNLRCAGAARAVATLALWQLGQHNTAHQRLAEARDAFQQLAAGNRRSLGPNWHEMLFFDLTLQKASHLLEDGSSFKPDLPRPNPL